MTPLSRRAASLGAALLLSSLLQVPLAQTIPATPLPARPPAPAVPSPAVPVPPTPAAPADAPVPVTPASTPVPAPVSPTRGIPATPLPPTPAVPAPSPVEAPKPPTPDLTLPDEELPPTPTAPLPPPAFEHAPGPAPAPAPRPAISRAPLLIVVNTTWPALVRGQKTGLPYSRTLTIPGARAAQLRQRGEVTASLAADLRKFITELAAPPQDARFEELWDGWAVVQRNGLQIDEARTTANVLAALKDPKGVKANVVVTGQIAPARTLEYFRSRGITTHLGTGETNYYGSSAARMTNIHVGASHFRDRLVDGRTLSFNELVGPVNLKTGFVTGLVIAGERTANGVGGGICQVSTTVFRALYGAGLPIAQRQNHSYQVHYYDPQGLDATIYQPNLDLKFTNDTGGALWFQTDWNDDEARLTIRVFGRSRDYTVAIREPRTLQSTPSPADRLIPDPTLKAGEKKQVDWAARGAVIEVTREFLRDGKVFRSDVLRSAYRPWPNIYLVGTRP